MKELKTPEIKLIGAFFLVAGLLGFFTFLINVFPLNSFTSFLYIFPTVLFAATVYSGYLLLVKENSKGLEIGRAVSALQIIQFHIAGLGYLFVTGAYLFVGFTNQNLGIDFGLETAFTINLSDESNNFVFRINVLAVAIFIYLTKVMNKVDDYQELQDAIKNQEQNLDTLNDSVDKTQRSKSNENEVS